MRAPLSWLRDYAPLTADVGDLADALSNLGLVVDGIERFGDGLDGVIVAKVLAIRPHPNADRIRLVDVDAGDGEALQIVCGAWNFAVGDLVPLAPAGTVLPGGMEIGRQKMRGEWSNGMLCSAPELGMSETADDGRGLLILPPDLAPAGTPVVEALHLPEVVFDLDISPNRPDALCMAGVARDLAAALGEPFSWPPPPAATAVDGDLGPAAIVVEAPDLCPRFTGTIIEGVPSGPSPAWLARRLTLAGMRPINAVVDVSNYVMLDLGQPNHAYDLDRLRGGGLLIRRGHPGEELVTLDGVTRHLAPSDCVICDAEGTPVGVGGIMGGSESEISPETRRVLLEAAWFLPMAIARTGVRLGLHSEARVRFERGVDPQIAPAAVERFVALLATIAGRDGTPPLRRGPTVDRCDDALPEGPSVRLRTARVNAILGVELDDRTVRQLLEPIGFRATATGAPEAGEHLIQVPSWRLEVEREIDVIEEVARMWGYRRIERSIPPGAPGGSGGLTDRQADVRRIREVLTGAGYDEAWTTTFLAPGDLERAGLDPAAVEVENPLDQSESILRTELLPGLLKAIRFNVDRQATDLCLFELGHVFGLPEDGLNTPRETERLGVIVAPATDSRPSAVNGSTTAVAAAVRTWGYLADALRMEPMSMRAEAVPGWHPTRSVRLFDAAGVPIATVGEVDPEVVLAYGLQPRIGYLSVDVDAFLASPRRALAARVTSRYPGSDVDLAFLTPESVPAAAVLATLRESGGELLERAWLFDVYRSDQVGAARRSLAFRLRFRALNHTLTDSELAAARLAAITAVTEAHGAELRT